MQFAICALIFWLRFVKKQAHFLSVYLLLLSSRQCNHLCERFAVLNQLWIYRCILSLTQPFSVHCETMRRTVVDNLDWRLSIYKKVKREIWMSLAFEMKITRGGHPTGISFIKLFYTLCMSVHSSFELNICISIKRHPCYSTDNIPHLPPWDPTHATYSKLVIFIQHNQSFLLSLEL